MQKKTAIIIGAGPAGLTAALELLRKTGIHPVILEKSAHIGGLSKTIDFEGNKIDIGGHRFYSKSEKIIDWWLEVLPLGTLEEAKNKDEVMLIRNRLSRIFFKRKFFDYPLQINLETISHLGWRQTFRIGLSYLAAKLIPKKDFKSLEDFFIHRFGRSLYEMFFRDYTEKVWGVPCSQIKPEWGFQRVKGLSIRKAILHALKELLPWKRHHLNVETSLIGEFYYPKLGPGQMWEAVAGLVFKQGGDIHCRQNVISIAKKPDGGFFVRTKDSGQNEKSYDGDYLISSMPLRDFSLAVKEQLPRKLLEIGEGILYRSHITVGLLFSHVHFGAQDEKERLDQWIYIQESDVKVARLQIYNNWSPFLVKEKGTYLLGLEYFCSEGDSFWNQSNEEILRFGREELEKLKIVCPEHFIKGTVIRESKAYPAYFGTYEKIDLLRNYFDKIPNLFLVGRNGMHRYNNQDHSMLTAIEAVENIIKGSPAKENIWQVNAEKVYCEEKKERI